MVDTCMRTRLEETNEKCVKFKFINKFKSKTLKLTSEESGANIMNIHFFTI